MGREGFKVARGRGPKVLTGEPVRGRVSYVTMRSFLQFCWKDAVIVPSRLVLGIHTSRPSGNEPYVCGSMAKGSGYLLGSPWSNPNCSPTR